MKKLFALLLAMILVIGTPIITFAADEAYDKQTAGRLAETIDPYFFYAELHNAYFAEGGVPYITMAHSTVENECSEYIVSVEYEYFFTYHIPAEVYEEIIFRFFTRTDALVSYLRSGSNYVADDGEPYYIIETGGGYGDRLPALIFQGYKKISDTKYEAYAYIADNYIEDRVTWEYINYVPEENEVEGVDYIVAPSSVYNYNYETGEADQYFGYDYYKLLNTMKSVIEISPSGYYTISSYECLDKTVLEETEGIVKNPNEKQDAYLDNMLADCECAVDLSEYSYNTRAYAIGVAIDYFEEFSLGNYHGYYVYATDNGSDITLNGETTLKLNYPCYDNFTDYSIYKIDGEGNPVVLPSTKEIKQKTDWWGDEYLEVVLTATIDELGYYAIAPSYKRLDSYYLQSFDTLMSEYSYYADLYGDEYGGAFAYGESPDGAVICEIIVNNSYMFQDYIEQTVITDTKYEETYKIPADYVEYFIFSMLAPSDALMSTLKSLYTSYDDGEYYEFTYDWMAPGEVNPYYEPDASVSFGAKELSDGVFEAYSYRGYFDTLDYDTYSYIPYVPAADEVEGVDYIYLPYSWYDENDMSENMKLYIGYRPFKLTGAAKSIIKENGGTFGIASYESISLEAAAELVNYTEYESRGGMLLSSMLGFDINLTQAHFDDYKNTVITFEDISSSSQAAEYVAEDEAAVLFTLSAEANGVPVTLNDYIDIQCVHYNSSEDVGAAIYSVDEVGGLSILDCYSYNYEDEYGFTANYVASYTDTLGTFLVTHAGETKTLSFDSDTYANMLTVGEGSYMCGDFDGDGSINSIDTLNLKTALAYPEYPLAETNGSDANGDGKINAKDLLYMYRYIAGLESYTVGNGPCADTVFDEAEDAVKLTDRGTWAFDYLQIDVSELQVDPSMYNYVLVTVKSDEYLSYVGINGFNMSVLGYADGGNEYITYICSMNELSLNGFLYISIAPGISSGDSMYIDSVSFASTLSAAEWDGTLLAHRAG